MTPCHEGTHAQQVAHEAALQSFVLLKNEGRTLPLKLGASVAVIGPLADTASLYAFFPPFPVDHISCYIYIKSLT